MNVLASLLYENTGIPLSAYCFKLDLQNLRTGLKASFELLKTSKHAVKLLFRESKWAAVHTPTGSVVARF